MKGLIFFKRGAALFSALLLVSMSLFSLPCCADPETEANPPLPLGKDDAPRLPEGVFSVPYDAGDSLNPFFCETNFNFCLSSLLYRSLYCLDSSYTLKNDLAVSESSSGTSYTVKIRPDNVFSDASSVGAEDVIYSFELAKKSFFWSENLRGIASCRATERFAVVFKLKYADVNALNALTFPIVKKGTADSAEDLPVGGGSYCFAGDGVRLSLSANLKAGKKLPKTGTVRLTDVSEVKNAELLVDSGELDFCFSDLSDSAINRVYSAVTGVYLNNLVFFGINSRSPVLGVPDIRRAVSCALDRKSIAENAYGGFARAANVPFNTSWSAFSPSAVAFASPFSGEPEKAARLFAAYGITPENHAHIEIVCSDTNTFVRNTVSLAAEMLKKYNVDVSVSALPCEELKSTVAAGKYDMYLAEIKLSPTMDLSEFFTSGGSACFGADLENSACVPAYFAYREGKTDIDGFLSVFCRELPFIPLCFRSGRLCYTRKLGTAVSCTEYRPYGEMPDWAFPEAD